MIGPANGAWIAILSLINIAVIGATIDGIVTKNVGFLIIITSWITLFSILTLIFEGVRFWELKDKLSNKEIDTDTGIRTSIYNLTSLSVAMLAGIILLFNNKMKDLNAIYIIPLIMFIGAVIMTSFKYIKYNEYIEFVKKNKTPETN